jgi:hypothetical protein
LSSQLPDKFSLVHHEQSIAYVCARGPAHRVGQAKGAMPLKSQAPALFPLDYLIECVERDQPSAASIEEARESLRLALRL